MYRFCDSVFPTTPAPGYRYYANGTLNDVGQYGYSRASAVAGGNVYTLNFGNGELIPQSSLNRARGLQVRCLQE